VDSEIFKTGIWTSRLKIISKVCAAYHTYKISPIAFQKKQRFFPKTGLLAQVLIRQANNVCNSGDIDMTEPNLTPEPIEEATPETMAIVKREMPDANEETIKETAALFESLKKRAAAEMQAAGEITREAYLKAVDQARSAFAQNKSIAQDKMHSAVGMIQKETEKNWLVIDAIKTRAQAQIQDAGEVSREAYLKAVRQAREAVEQNKLVERDRVEQAVDQIHKQADKNWHVVAGEIESIGTRLKETAKSAWSKLAAFVEKARDRDNS
jgi:hypothetical protein